MVGIISPPPWLGGGVGGKYPLAPQVRHPCPVSALDIYLNFNPEIFDAGKENFLRSVPPTKKPITVYKNST